MNVSRRKLLKLLGMASASIVVSSGLHGCELLNNDADLSVNFKHGVASGDPLSDRVIIWTRVTPSKQTAVEVVWQVAEDQDFNTLVNQDRTTVSERTDFTLKVDVTGLEAGKTYFYRFISQNTFSPIGTTKTSPAANTAVASAQFAVFSCANFPAGFFHIYAAAAERANQLDAVLHLGDYIYEYDKAGYPDAGSGEDINRVHQPVTECLNLADYRQRYAQYRTDSDLQMLHAKLPFICIWDDHEIANDAYKGGAENHQANEGDFTDRRANAIQAWYEWLPVRAPAVEADRIKTYRRFDYGNLVSLMMLDTRIIGRDQQLDYTNYYSVDGVFDSVSFQADMQDNNRSLLGNEQLNWLQEQLQSSVASGTNWQVLGQQVLMGKMTLPSSIIQLNPQTGKPDPQNLITYQITAQAYQALATAVVTDLTVQGDLNNYAAMIPNFTSLNEAQQGIALTQAVETNEPNRYAQIFASLTAEQQTTLANNGALLDPTQNPSIPYNLDAWDGYGVERETLYAYSKALAANLVVLAGDTHNGWANHLTDQEGSLVGVEFATSSVSSPGMEKYLSIPEGAEAQTEAGIVQLVSDLQYTNLSQRGYLEVIFTPEQVTGEWFYIPRNAEKLTQLPTVSQGSKLTSSRTSPGFTKAT